MNHHFTRTITTLDHLVISRAAASHDRPYISRLRLSARNGRESTCGALRCVQSALDLLAEIEQRKPLRPAASPAPERPLPGAAAVTQSASPTTWWDIYPAVEKAVRLGEVEAADRGEAIKRAAEKFMQPPTILIVMRRA
jgi:hypothetical protein